MSIRAVVFDIGGVLALCEPMDFDRRWEASHGLAEGTIGAMMGDMWRAGEIGTATEREVRGALADRLGLTSAQVGAFMDEFWRQYLGVANTELIAYARSLRPAYRTGILSNSFVGAREREEVAFGFGSLVDDIVYSHEVGMSKPDPALWKLTCERMNTAPSETVFVDNAPRLVESARSFGIHAVLFTSTEQTIADVSALLTP
jgi:epoxide hydrolase-like predicted phosphatase